MTSARPHVLVAEDNQLVCDAMRMLFEETGHRVSVAGHVAEIVDIASSDRVDLLLLDLRLADGDGLDVLTELRARESLPRVTVALTGRDDAETIGRCTSAGCRAVLLKPVPTRDLLRMAKEWLGSGT